MRKEATAACLLTMLAGGTVFLLGIIDMLIAYPGAPGDFVFGGILLVGGSILTGLSSIGWAILGTKE